jgi:glutaredoxin
MPLSITMHGRPTCEDTALARERLNALGIAYHETNVDTDPASAAIAEQLNHGQRVTPTIVFGDEEFVIREPTIKALDAALKRAGHAVNFARMIQFGPPISDRSAPMFDLPASHGGAVRLAAYRHRKFLIVAIVPTPLSDEGLAGLRALNNLHEALTAHHQADALAIVSGHARAARIGSHLPMLIDADGGVGAKYAALHDRLDLPALFVLDRYGAPRAGGPLTPLHATEAVAWIEFLECECDE